MGDKITQKIRFFISNADEYLCSCILSFSHKLKLTPLLLSSLAFELILKAGIVYIYKKETEDQIDKKLKKCGHDLPKIYKELCNEYPGCKNESIELNLENYYRKIEIPEGHINQHIYGRARYSAGVILICSLEEVLEPYLFLREKITTLVKDEVGDLPMAEQYTQIIRKYNKLIQKDFVTILNKSNKKVRYLGGGRDKENIRI